VFSWIEFQIIGNECVGKWDENAVLDMGIDNGI